MIWEETWRRWEISNCKLTQRASGNRRPLSHVPDTATWYHVLHKMVAYTIRIRPSRGSGIVLLSSSWELSSKTNDRWKEEQQTSCGHYSDMMTIKYSLIVGLLISVVGGTTPFSILALKTDLVCATKDLICLKHDWVINQRLSDLTS